MAGDDESSVGCGLCRDGRMHVPIGGPSVLDATEATGAFGGKRAARSRTTLRRNAASGRVAGEGEDARPIVGFTVEITSLRFSHEGAVERDLSNVRYLAHRPFTDSSQVAVRPISDIRESRNVAAELTVASLGSLRQPLP